MLVDYQAIMRDRFSHKSYSQEGEDMILRRLFDSRNTGFYVDVGAHHPMRFSNTHFFYRQGWRGINIEPNPEAIRAFRVFRPRDITLQIGVGESAGALTYFCFDDPALNTFDGELAKQREQTTRYRIVSTLQVPVTRLEDILSRHVEAGQAIDFMSVDAEGYDFKVIQSNNWSRYRPRYLLVECLRSSLASLSGHPIHQFLQSNGYDLYAKTVNTVFYRDSRQTS